MKKKSILILIIFIFIVAILDIFKYPFIFNLPFNIPGSQMAATIPPFGIFIEKNHKNDDREDPCSLYQHEIIHWEQYTRMGFFSFNFNYLAELIKYDRKNNWFEDEARVPCNTKTIAQIKDYHLLNNLKHSIKQILFWVLSIPVIIISWRTLFNLKSHGFYRFLSWECIIWLFVSNYPYWFKDPLSLPQIFSWIFLVASGYTILAGVITLKRKGKAGKERDDSNLYTFEKTSELVDTGIYKYIRHPLYASLLYLTWGTCLKNPTWILLLISVASSIFLLITALLDEKECTMFFGEKYKEYMKRSKRFIPFLF